jgi:hypothetical protein
MRNALVDSEATITFLAGRLGRNGKRGISSDAMIISALENETVDEGSYPWDIDDLERCVRTWLEAPIHMRFTMLKTLGEFVTHIATRTAEAREA